MEAFEREAACFSRVSSRATKAPLSTRQVFGTDRFGQPAFVRRAESPGPGAGTIGPGRLENFHEPMVCGLPRCVLAQALAHEIGLGDAALARFPFETLGHVVR
jgi:hypothetical protein